MHEHHVRRRRTGDCHVAGRTVASENALGERSTTIYDAAGRAIVAEDPLGHRNTATFDAAGRNIASTNPLDEMLPTELPSHFLPNYGCRDLGPLRGGFAELLRILEKGCTTILIG